MRNSYVKEMKQSIKNEKNDTLQNLELLKINLQHDNSDYHIMVDINNYLKYTGQTWQQFNHYLNHRYHMYIKNDGLHSEDPTANNLNTADFKTEILNIIEELAIDHCSELAEHADNIM